MNRTDHLTWGDATRALAAVQRHDGDWHTLLLLARLPLLPTTALERLDHLNGPACVYRRLARLSAAGLLRTIRPPLRAGANPHLLHLTDLGLAVLALAHHVEPAALARHFHLRGTDLLALAPRLPHL